MGIELNRAGEDQKDSGVAKQREMFGGLHEMVALSFY